MNNDPILRRLGRHETDAAAGVHRRAMATMPCFNPALHTPAEDRAFYRDVVFAECTILGAFEGDVLLGHVAFKPGWISHLYVDPEHHRRGIGTRLLERMKAEMDEIELWTFQANQAARQFYERHGFVAVEFTDGSSNEETEPDARYLWRSGTKANDPPS